MTQGKREKEKGHVLNPVSLILHYSVSSILQDTKYQYQAGTLVYEVSISNPKDV